MKYTPLNSRETKLLAQYTKNKERGCLFGTLFDCTKIILYHAITIHNQNILTDEDSSESDTYLESLI